ncbi:hypothetical protein T484DRAFT_1773605, partial [Baffinella frigidus]
VNYRDFDKTLLRCRPSVSEDDLKEFQSGLRQDCKPSVSEDDFKEPSVPEDDLKEFQDFTNNYGQDG